MRRFIFLTSLFLMSVASLSAQQIYRSEFSVFDTREDALKGDHTKTEGHIPFAPKSVEVVGKVEVVGQSFEMPTAWSDYNIYLHLQNTIKAYDLVVRVHISKRKANVYDRNSLAHEIYRRRVRSRR